MLKSLFLALIIICIYSCTTDEDNADLIIHNGQIYTMDSLNTIVEAIAIKDEIIIGTGSLNELAKYKTETTKFLDASQNMVIPGFIEGHGHFSGLGFSLIHLNFLNAKNWAEIEEQVKQKVATKEKGAWIEGRGWHQEKWDTTPLDDFEGYPVHSSISALTPDNPIILKHASGHSLFANAKAMELVGISKEMPNPIGGKIVRDRNDEAIGVFEERAMQPFLDAYKAYQDQQSKEEILAEWHKAIKLASNECISKGITSFQDAGSSLTELRRYESLANQQKLPLRLWVMARDHIDSLRIAVQHKKIDFGNKYYTCRAIKSEVDGALGAFGAWLLKPYNDKKDFMGQNTTDIKEVAAIADLALENEMQLCVHAIGDRANRVVLDIFEGKLDNAIQNGEDPRWRIEHAQHLSIKDIPRFNALKAIASMQGIHCTSDAPFVEKRLGNERAKTGAYAWRSLIDAGTLIANGTDTPVEDVDPIKNYYASVTRKRSDNGLEFFTEQSMTRLEALKSYTIWNAYAAFEEAWKGSLEVNKVADICILDQNIMTCSDDEILSTKVLYTIIGGKMYKN